MRFLMLAAVVGILGGSLLASGCADRCDVSFACDDEHPCGAGDTCVGGVCQDAAAACGVDVGELDAGTPHDSGAGRDGGAPLDGGPAPFPDGGPVDGGAVGAPCLTDLDCATTACVDGVCAGLGVGSACAAPHHCERGACDTLAGVCAGTSVGAVCEVDGQCALDNCAGGVCVDVTLGLACTEDADCASDNCAGGVCTDNALGSACDDDGDCATHNCAGGVCVGNALGLACTNDADCVSGNCTDDVCTGTGVGAACSRDEQCATTSCANDLCATNDVGAACEDDEDCDTGSCVGDICSGNAPGDACNGNADCASRKCTGDVCVADTPGAPCNVDDECESALCNVDDTCSGLPGNLPASCAVDGDCPAGFPCVAGDCVRGAVGDACAANGDCITGNCDEAGGVCVLGLPGEACDNNGHCRSDRCVNGVCRAGANGDPCDVDSDCRSDLCVTVADSGSVCSGGFTGDACANDNDCRADHCFNDTCVPGFGGDACAAQGDCESGNCADSVCVVGVVGDACDGDNDCVSNNCQAGVCIHGTVGETCSAATGCRSGFCGISTCTLGAGGDVCDDSGDCLSLVCSDGVCRAGIVGDPCARATDCATGICGAGACTLGANGDACDGPFDCRFGGCQDGACVADAAETLPAAGPVPPCATEPDSCACDVVIAEGSAYAYCAQNRSFDAAAAECEAMGMQLAIIESADEDALVRSLRPIGERSRNFWIGLRSVAPAGPTWVDGRPVVYEGWSQAPSGPGSCARQPPPGEEAWQWSPCTNALRFVCEWHFAGTCGDGDGDSYGDGCPFGADCDDERPDIYPGAADVCDGVNNDCAGGVDDDAAHCDCPPLTIAAREYRHCTEPLSWDDARARCLELEMDLVTVGDDGENNALAALTPGGITGGAWIGLNDKGEEGTFVWAADGSALSYESWAAFEPSGVITGSFEDCVAMSSGGGWYDIGCGSDREYFCEQVP